jgi:hypothetical protein
MNICFFITYKPNIRNEAWHYAGFVFRAGGAKTGYITAI